MRSKYIFLHLQTREGEREYDHKSVHILPYNINEEEWSDDYCRTFWMGAPGEMNDDGYYEFDNGCIWTQIVEWRKISKSHYNILKNYL